MTDQLGIRMKNQYESRTRFMLPRRTFTIIRLDGKAFHTFTRGMNKPFDEDLMKAMNHTAAALCDQIQGAKFAYVQSDEISLLLTDFAKVTTNAWFDGNLQKMASISASIATVAFNEFGLEKAGAMFDSRVFTIPDPVEVENYFIWRQRDAVRNSIQMTGQNLYSNKELNEKNTSEIQEMCFQKGVNWNDMPAGFKRGRLIVKEKFYHDEVERSKWVVQPAFQFTKEIHNLIKLIPKLPY